VNPDQCQQRPDGVWVCRECSFAYDLQLPAAIARVSAASQRSRQSAAAVSERLDVAPQPGIWTPRQYLAHLADWYEIIADRIERVVNEDRPLITSHDQDQLAVDRAYHTWDVSSTLDRLERAAERAVTVIRAGGEAGWHRIGVRDDMGEISVALFANDLVHELDHHLLDVSGGPVGR
jgi:hypothetical protein